MANLTSTCCCDYIISAGQVASNPVVIILIARYIGAVLLFATVVTNHKRLIDHLRNSKEMERQLQQQQPEQEMEQFDKFIINLQRIRQVTEVLHAPVKMHDVSTSILSSKIVIHG